VRGRTATHRPGSTASAGQRGTAGRPAGGRQGCYRPASSPPCTYVTCMVKASANWMNVGSFVDSVMHVPAAGAAGVLSGKFAFVGDCCALCGHFTCAASSVPQLQPTCPSRRAPSGRLLPAPLTAPCRPAQSSYPLGRVRLCISFSHPSLSHLPPSHLAKVRLRSVGLGHGHNPRLAGGEAPAQRLKGTTAAGGGQARDLLTGGSQLRSLGAVPRFHSVRHYICRLMMQCSWARSFDSSVWLDR